MKTLTRTLIVISALLSFSSASHAQADQCMDIGGVAIPNFFPEGEGKPIIISATLTGSVTNAAGKILSQRETKTGLTMEMEHYFGRGDGGTIYTKDIAILTAVPGKPGRFMIEINYDIQEGKGRGSLRDYTGQFASYGLVDLRDPGDMQGLVRYTGNICK